jgi:hypothetical protein
LATKAPSRLFQTCVIHLDAGHDAVVVLKDDAVLLVVRPQRRSARVARVFPDERRRLYLQATLKAAGFGR